MLWLLSKYIRVKYSHGRAREFVEKVAANIFLFMQNEQILQKQNIFKIIMDTPEAASSTFSRARTLLVNIRVFF